VAATSAVPAIDLVKRLVNIVVGPLLVVPTLVAGHVQVVVDASCDSQRFLGESL